MQEAGHAKKVQECPYRHRWVDVSGRLDGDQATCDSCEKTFVVGSMVASEAYLVRFLRVAAFLIDFVVLALLGLVMSFADPGFTFGVLIVVGPAWILLRDSVAGRSPGKLIVGLQVVSESGKLGRIDDLIERNFLFLLAMIPFLGRLVLFVEGLVLFASRDGRRLGDRIASTVVVRVRR